MDREESQQAGSVGLRPIWAHRWFVLAVVILATAATYAYYSSRPKEYSAKSTLYVDVAGLLSGQTNPGTAYDPGRITRNQAQLLTTPAIAARAAEIAHLDLTAGQMLARVQADPSVTSDFIEVTGKGGTGAEAARVANAFANAFRELTSANRRRTLTAEEVRIRKQLRALAGRDTVAAAQTRADLNTQLQRNEIAQNTPTSGIVEIDPAQPRSQPDTPRPVRNSIFAAVMALLLAAAIAFGLDQLERRIRDLEDLESLVPFPVLGSIPHASSATAIRNGIPVVPEEQREALRTLRVNLQLQEAVDRPLRRILVTSPVSGDGKSSIIRNLALVFAESGTDVTIVEADLRRPSLAEMFGFEANSAGVTSRLAGLAGDGGAMLSVAQEAQRTDPDGLRADGAEAIAVAERLAVRGSVSLLPAGAPPPSPPTVLSSARFAELLDEVQPQSGVLLIDTPPITVVADALPILPLVDGVILVVRIGQSTREPVRRAIEALNRISGVRIIGVLANDTEQASGYGDYAYHEARARKRDRAKR